MGADEFFTWASEGMALGICHEAANLPEGEDIGAIVNGMSTEEQKEHWEAISAMYEALPDSCRDWPFNDEHQWNFTNMLPYEGQQWEVCRIPIERA